MNKSVCVVIKRNVLKRFFIVSAFLVGAFQSHNTSCLNKNDFNTIEYIILKTRSEKMFYDALEKRAFYEKMFAVGFAGQLGSLLGSSCSALLGCDDRMIKTLQVAAVGFLGVSLSSLIPIHFQNKIIDHLIELEEDSRKHIASLPD